MKMQENFRETLSEISHWGRATQKDKGKWVWQELFNVLESTRIGRKRRAVDFNEDINYDPTVINDYDETISNDFDNGTISRNDTLYLPDNLKRYRNGGINRIEKYKTRQLYLK